MNFPTTKPFKCWGDSLLYTSLVLYRAQWLNYLGSNPYFFLDLQQHSVGYASLKQSHRHFQVCKILACGRITRPLLLHRSRHCNCFTTEAKTHVSQQPWIYRRIARGHATIYATQRWNWIRGRVLNVLPLLVQACNSVGFMIHRISVPRTIDNDRWEKKLRAVGNKLHDRNSPSLFGIELRTINST